MNLSEMHTMFRQFVQQMGLQLTRAILPEQIDLVLNTSITDVTNNIIRENIGLTNDRVITDNSKISQVNALRSLYKIKEINLIPTTNIVRVVFAGVKDYDSGKITISNTSSSLNPEPIEKIGEIGGSIGGSITNGTVLLDINFDTVYGTNDDSLINVLKTYYNDNVIKVRVLKETNLTIEIETASSYSSVEGSAIIDTEDSTKTITGTVTYSKAKRYINSFKKHNAYNGKIESINLSIHPMFFVDFSLNYKEVTKGFNSKAEGYEYDLDNSFETNIYPVRLIDDAYLADVLNDFILKPRFRSPIIVNHDNLFDLYIERFNSSSIGYTLKNKFLPYILRVSYIDKPCKVEYREDRDEPNINCDLPDYLHVDIVKHAVDLWRIAVNGSLHSSQQQEQVQQQEDARNQ